MSETSQGPSCDRCGAALSGHAQDRLCAACLLESAILEPEFASNLPASAPPLLAFNDYELLEEIARGGMGVVYRARQIKLNRPVAIKMILGGHLVNAAETKRFRSEAEIAAQLQHPNIVAIHEVGEHAGQPFFSMDLVAGQNLAQLVREEPLPSHKAASYLKTIAEAVHYAHSRGVLHRDLKPSNVLIDENDQPRVTDFGLAKRLPNSEFGTQNSELTQTGQVLGSPSFIPPEQAAGQKNAISPASDVYSLGAILYHLLTGHPPFVADTLTQTLRMVAETDPVSPRLLNASVSRDLETICLKCLEKDSARRYTTAREVADELDHFLRGEPIRARPVGAALKVHRWCLRNKLLAAAGTAILVLLLAIAVGSPIAFFRIDRERKRTEQNAVNEERQRKQAVEARKNETQLRQKAEAQELETRRYAYASDMAMVQSALEVNALGRARELLDRYRPQPGQNTNDDLRGWEWRYFWQFCKEDEAVPLCQVWSISSVSFSRSGRLLAVGTIEGELAVWDRVTRQRVFAEREGPAFSRKVTFSPSSGLLAYNGRSGLMVWDSDTQKPVRRMETHGYVRDLEFCKDGRLFTATTRQSDGVTLWEAESGSVTAISHEFLKSGFPFRVFRGGSIFAFWPYFLFC